MLYILSGKTLQAFDFPTYSFRIDTAPILENNAF